MLRERACQIPEDHILDDVGGRAPKRKSVSTCLPQKFWAVMKTGRSFIVQGFFLAIECLAGPPSRNNNMGSSARHLVNNAFML
jgi:hypothetical protein